MEVKYYPTSQTDCASNDNKSISWIRSASLCAWISPTYIQVTTEQPDLTKTKDKTRNSAVAKRPRDASCHW